MNERLSKDWIKEIQLKFKVEVEKQKELDKGLWKRINSYESTKEGRKRYLKSFKGKAARRRIYSLRSTRIKKYKLSKKEQGKILRFYVTCPAGMHVDHIIPLAKGGKHEMKNLQYLPPHINHIKGAKLFYKPSDPPQCLLWKEYLKE